MSDPSLALQTAIFSALDSALSCSVYDHVPQAASYPYVVIAQVSTDNAEFLNARKDRKTVYLAVYSTYRGQKEVQELMATISDTLHNNKLSLTTGRIASIRVIGMDTNREPDGVTYMGQVRVSVLVEHG